MGQRTGRNRKEGRRGGGNRHTMKQYFFSLDKTSSIHPHSHEPGPWEKYPALTLAGGCVIPFVLGRARWGQQAQKAQSPKSRGIFGPKTKFVCKHYTSTLKLRWRKGGTNRLNQQNRHKGTINKPVQLLPPSSPNDCQKYACFGVTDRGVFNRPNPQRSYHETINKMEHAYKNKSW